MTDSDTRERAQPGQRGRYRQALRSHDLRLLLLSFLIDETGSWSYSVVLAAYVYGRTGAPGWVAAVVATRWITGLLVGGFAGVLADRYERTMLIRTGALAGAATMVVMTVLVATDGPLWALLAMSVLATVAGAANRPAVSAMIPELVSEQDLTAANALFAVLENLVVVLGPALAGLLLVLGSPATAVGLNAASFCVAVVLFAFVRTRSRGAAETGKSMVRQLADGWQALRNSPTAFILVLYLVLDSAVFGANTVVFGPLSEHLGTGPNGYSYLMAAGALGGVLGASVANRVAARPRLAAVIIGGLAVESLPMAFTALTDLPVVAAALQVIFGVGMVVVDIVGVTALQREISGEVLGRVNAIMMSMVLGINVVASFAATALLDGVGLTGTLLCVGIGIPALGLLGLRTVVRQDRANAGGLAVLEPRVALLTALDLFSGAARPVLERLAGSARERHAAPGEVVINQGDPADALYLLVDGVLDVTVRDASGTPYPRPDVVAPGYVGELGLLRRIPRTATVTAKTPSTLLRIEADDFFGALESAGASASMLSLAGERFWRYNRPAAE